MQRSIGLWLYCLCSWIQEDSNKSQTSPCNAMEAKPVIIMIRKEINLKQAINVLMIKESVTDRENLWVRRVFGRRWLRRLSPPHASHSSLLSESPAIPSPVSYKTPALLSPQNTTLTNYIQIIKQSQVTTNKLSEKVSPADKYGSRSQPEEISRITLWHSILGVPEIKLINNILTIKYKN